MKSNHPKLLLEPISAGFPNAAEDAPSVPLDLNYLVITHPAATFFMRVSGDSMEGDAILDGDIIVVDKSLQAKTGDRVVAYIDGTFTMKQFRKDRDHGWLVAANPKYAPIKITADNDFAVWGVVTAVVRTLST